MGGMNAKLLINEGRLLATRFIWQGELGSNLVWTCAKYTQAQNKREGKRAEKRSRKSAVSLIVIKLVKGLCS